MCSREDGFDFVMLVVLAFLPFFLVFVFFLGFSSVPPNFSDLEFLPLVSPFFERFGNLPTDDLFGFGVESTSSSWLVLFFGTITGDDGGDTDASYDTSNDSSDNSFFFFF